MTQHSTSQPIEALIGAMPAGCVSIATELHHTIQSQGCAHKVSPEGAPDKFTINYSGRNCALHLSPDGVTLACEYDIRAILDFYRTTKDEKAKELLFQAAFACCYCIDDKCTTLLTDRHIEWNGQQKQLCGPYNHHLEIKVSPDAVESAKAIIIMAFQYCTPAMHVDLFHDSAVTVNVVEKGEFHAVGYLLQRNPLSIQVEDFVSECLAADGNGKRKMDDLLALCGQTDEEKYIGVTRNFISGSRYDFLFGVPCDKTRLPATLPESVVVAKLYPGEYAVYNSGAGEYDAIWKHFTESFYDGASKGYDIHREPFEYFDKDGRFSDVHIPVSAEMPKRSGEYAQVVFTPDILMAGFPSCNENDHPLYRPGYDEVRATGFKAAFPRAERIIGACIHAELGQPMLYLTGVERDREEAVPEGFEPLMLRGGYWQITGCRHFTGGSGGDYLFSLPFKTPYKIDTLNHPRAFIEYTYTGRGGYREIAVPLRIVGERTVEVVDRETCLYVGMEEDPPRTTVTPAIVNAIKQAPGNLDPDTYTTAFYWEMHESKTYFKRPVIKGARVADFSNVPEGMNTFTLEGGKYVRIGEKTPNGGKDWWTLVYAFNGEMEKETGYKMDMSRRFFVETRGMDSAFTAFVPVV